MTCGTFAKFEPSHVRRLDWIFLAPFRIGFCSNPAGRRACASFQSICVVSGTGGKFLPFYCTQNPLSSKSSKINVRPNISKKISENSKKNNPISPNLKNLKSLRYTTIISGNLRTHFSAPDHQHAFQHVQNSSTKHTKEFVHWPNTYFSTYKNLVLNIQKNLYIGD